MHTVLPLPPNLGGDESTHPIETPSVVALGIVESQGWLGRISKKIHQVYSSNPAALAAIAPGVPPILAPTAKLDGIPHGYKLYERHSSEGRKDKYLYGNPLGVFRSAEDFSVHLESLILRPIDPTVQCLCKAICSKSSPRNSPRKLQQSSFQRSSATPEPVTMTVPSGTTSIPFVSASAVTPAAGPKNLLLANLQKKKAELARKAAENAAAASALSIAATVSPATNPPHSVIEQPVERNILSAPSTQIPPAAVPVKAKTIPAHRKPSPEVIVILSDGEEEAERQKQMPAGIASDSSPKVNLKSEPVVVNVKNEVMESSNAFTLHRSRTQTPERERNSVEPPESVSSTDSHQTMISRLSGVVKTVKKRTYNLANVGSLKLAPSLLPASSSSTTLTNVQSTNPSVTPMVSQSQPAPVTTIEMQTSTHISSAPPSIPVPATQTSQSMLVIESKVQQSNHNVPNDIANSSMNQPAGKSQQSISMEPSLARMSPHASHSESSNISSDRKRKLESDFLPLQVTSKRISSIPSRHSSDQSTAADAKQKSTTSSMSKADMDEEKARSLFNHIFSTRPEIVGPITSEQLETLYPVLKKGKKFDLFLEFVNREFEQRKEEKEKAPTLDVPSAIKNTPTAASSSTDTAASTSWSVPSSATPSPVSIRAISPPHDVSFDNSKVEGLLKRCRSPSEDPVELKSDVNEHIDKRIKAGESAEATEVVEPSLTNEIIQTVNPQFMPPSITMIPSSPTSDGQPALSVGLSAQSQAGLILGLSSSSSAFSSSMLKSDGSNFVGFNFGSSVETPTENTGVSSSFSVPVPSFGSIINNINQPFSQPSSLSSFQPREADISNYLTALSNIERRPQTPHTPPSFNGIFIPTGKPPRHGPLSVDDVVWVPVMIIPSVKYTKTTVSVKDQVSRQLNLEALCQKNLYWKGRVKRVIKDVDPKTCQIWKAPILVDELDSDSVALSESSLHNAEKAVSHYNVVIELELFEFPGFSIYMEEWCLKQEQVLEISSDYVLNMHGAKWEDVVKMEHIGLLFEKYLKSLVI